MRKSLLARIRKGKDKSLKSMLGVWKNLLVQRDSGNLNDLANALLVKVNIVRVAKYWRNIGEILGIVGP